MSDTLQEIPPSPLAELFTPEESDELATLMLSFDGGMLDYGELDGFLSALAHLRAQKFQPGAAKPDHKLSLPEGAMDIAITFEGDKEPSYKLTVGPLHSADKGHYAATNKLADTVVLLPEEPFKGPLSGTSYFRK